MFFRVLIKTAEVFMNLGYLTEASSTIEEACVYILQGEKDEMHVYFLAFKLHCMQNASQENEQ